MLRRPQWNNGAFGGWTRCRLLRRTLICTPYTDSRWTLWTQFVAAQSIYLAISTESHTLSLVEGRTVELSIKLYSSVKGITVGCANLWMCAFWSHCAVSTCGVSIARQRHGGRFANCGRRCRRDFASTRLESTQLDFLASDLHFCLRSTSMCCPLAYVHAVRCSHGTNERWADCAQFCGIIWRDWEANPHERCANSAHNECSRAAFQSSWSLHYTHTSPPAAELVSCVPNATHSPKICCHCTRISI